MQSHQPSSNGILSYLFSFFQRSTTEVKDLPKKPHRSRTAFSTNLSASLAVPIKSLQPIEKKTTPVVENNSLTSYFTSFVNRFFSTAEKPVEKKPESKKVSPPKPIAKLIEALEKELIEEKDPLKIDQVFSQKVDLLGDQIKEHAARRVDLFFYLLLTVHGKQVSVSKDHTIKQNGKGSKKKGTQACHSSLFPNLKMTGLPRDWSWILPANVDLSFKGTHFDESLNMTVELPKVVNAFDQRLEGRFGPSKYTKEILEILNKAAKDEIDPIEGMNQFFKVLQQFFVRFEENNKKKKGSHQAMFKVLEYEKEGTFKATDKDFKIEPDYLYLMLRLTAAEKLQAQKNPKYLRNFYQRIQEEILNSKISSAEESKPVAPGRA